MREFRPLLKGGTLNGILVSKGEFWIEVKDDIGYAGDAWLPGMVLGRQGGGGFDPTSLRRFGELMIGNRVSMKWSWDGHLRALEIEIIKPSKERGMFEGYLLEIGDRWIDVQMLISLWRFYLPQVEGYPQNGGGFDQSLIEPFLGIITCNPILFWWNIVRPKFIKLVTREEISFKPFTN